MSADYWTGLKNLTCTFNISLKHCREQTDLDASNNFSCIINMVRDKIMGIPVCCSFWYVMDAAKQ